MNRVGMHFDEGAPKLMWTPIMSASCWAVFFSLVASAAVMAPPLTVLFDKWGCRGPRGRGIDPP